MRAPLVLPLLLPALLVGGEAVAQAGVATLGLQVKPVVVTNYFEPSVDAEREHLRYVMDLKGGFAFGMSVRVGITNTISLETGLGSIRRNYAFTLANDTSLYQETGTVRYAGYELPITGLVHMRLGERTWMNTALGASLDFYPSDVEAVVKEGSVYIFRRNWAQVGIVGNIGVEYRTEKSGYFYLGATFHRPFGDMAQADATWLDRYASYRPYRMTTGLSGSYLTLDLRYFFHEDPDKARMRKARGR